jgi:hypothetical protein
MVWISLILVVFHTNNELTSVSIGECNSDLLYAFPANLSRFIIEKM